jgi:hypothetical protein
MNNIDTNIDNYTINELFSILNNPSSNEEMMYTTNKYINKYTNENNNQMLTFFKNIQNKLSSLSFFYDSDQNEITNNTIDEKENIQENDDEDTNNQTKEWLQNLPALSQNNNIQNNKITDRTQQVGIYDDDTHYPMGRNQLGINNNINVPISQDKLNPNLENITSRLIMLDSLFRQSSTEHDNTSITDYVCDLSDQLRNVLSLRLYSYQIPNSWYLIDVSYGNSCFWIYNNLNYFEINITSGNYTPTTFITELITTINSAGFLTVTTTNIYYTTSTGKITFNFDGITDPSGNIIYGTDYESELITDPRLIFFDYTQTLKCSTSSCYSSLNYTFTNTLGWIMGFRKASESILNSGNTADAIFDYYGSKYFILIIDDYNQNHINNGLVTITELSKKLDVPFYFTQDTAYTCSNFNNTAYYNNLNIPNTNDDLYIISDKVIDKTKIIPQVLPNAPRTITNSQIYTINEIIKNNSRNTKFKILPANPNDSFAIFTLDKNNLSLGNFITENGSSLQTNKRVYFGPVDIDRLRVRLIDDRGNLVNFNGLNWNIVLIAEILYQY